jgi:hypothetical protein
VSDAKTPAKPDAAEHKSRSQRSPNYPFFGLEEALRRVRVLHDMEGVHFAPVSVAIKHWDYNEKSSVWMQSVAAMKAFGLLDEEGIGTQRKVKASAAARAIFLDKREPSPDRDRLIREAALAPKSHQLLWSTYGIDMPSDPTVETFLCMESGFSEPAAKLLIKEYRATILFAGVTSADKIASDGPDAPKGAERHERDGEIPPPPPPPRAPQTARATEASMQDYTIPLPSGRVAVIRLPSPMSEADFAMLKAAWDVLKPGFLAAGRSPEGMKAEEK